MNTKYEIMQMTRQIPLTDLNLFCTMEGKFYTVVYNSMRRGAETDIYNYIIFHVYRTLEPAQSLRSIVRDFIRNLKGL
jgi:hypothetical protein